MSIAQNIQAVRETIERVAEGRRIYLVGAAKTKPAEAVREAIAAGIDAIGENHVQEIRAKGAEGAYEGAPVHLIGHLQRNKVRFVAGRVDLIESIDSAAILTAVARRAAELGAVQDVLLEINIGREPDKTGMDPDALDETLALAASLPGIRVRGLMAIPPAGRSGPYFDRMRKLFIDNAGKKYDNVYMDYLSMGMSHDYPEAIAAGANMVRVGSAIFGGRTYAAD